MTCEHNMFCTGHGPEHDFFTIGTDNLMNARAEAKRLLRSGDPRKRTFATALGQRIQAALDFGKTVPR